MPHRRRGIFSSGLTGCTCCAGVILEQGEAARVSHKMTPGASQRAMRCYEFSCESGGKRPQLKIARFTEALGPGIALLRQGKRAYALAGQREKSIAHGGQNRRQCRLAQT